MSGYVIIIIAVIVVIVFGISVYYELTHTPNSKDF